VFYTSLPVIVSFCPSFPDPRAWIISQFKILIIYSTSLFTALVVELIFVLVV